MKKIKYIDLFSGIGGFRLGFNSEKYECVYSVENEPHAIEIYKKNFGDDPTGDITKIDTKDIPDFDVLLAGFPCQAFSISGKQKGFYDETRGTLFFDICRILNDKKPKAFVLENVAHLEHHDGGNTINVMLNSLEELGYSVSYKVLNAREFGVPQNRRRIILVGSKNGLNFNFDLLKTNKCESMENFLDLDDEADVKFEYLEEDKYTLIDEKYIKKQPSGLMFVGYLNKPIRTKGVRENTEHLSRVHRQPNRIYSVKGIHPTITSQESSGRYWILLRNNKVRKLTLKECFRFMGFPEDFKLTGSNMNLYARIGNSVCVPMIREIANQILLQFFKDEGDVNMENPTEYMNRIYSCAIQEEFKHNLDDEKFNWIKKVADSEETNKGVFTVLFTSLVYKSLNPNQDIRYHQSNMKNGYSGRSFDTKYVTPFLKNKRFYGAMKESGWLTRSLEQNLPYDLDYPGKINNIKLKECFLNILNDIEINKSNPETYLKSLINISYMNKKKHEVKLINPINRESKLSIKEIIDLLKKHFTYNYSISGASILPVIAIQSIYECLVEELKRFENTKLLDMGSHTSSDRSSGDIGDINIKYKDDFYEGVEVKFDIPIDYYMVFDAYKKIRPTKTQRYYILSTSGIKEDDSEKINEYIKEIEAEHGCQIIVNGIYDSLKYYLRLIENTDDFIEKYIYNIQNNIEVKQEHKVVWNKLMDK